MKLQAAYDAVVTSWAALSPDARASLLDGFSVSYAYNSGKLENDAVTYHDTHEIFGKGHVIAYTGDIKTLFEIQNLKNAWSWMRKRCARLRMEGLSAEEMLDAHAVVTRGTYSEELWERGERPGAYKVGEHVVGVSDVGSPARDVPGEMASLAAEVSEALRDERACGKALTIAAYLHAVLVDIHPFADGNGRTARTLMNLVLLGLGHPPVSVAESHRMAYYGALDQFHEGEGLDGLEDFLRAETVACWERLVGGGQFDDVVVEAERPNP